MDKWIPKTKMLWVVGTPMAKIPVAILLPAVCVAHAMLLIIR